MKQYIVVIGNFGSGKTELALNLAFAAAKTQRVSLVDLDIINPYFRSSERKRELEAAGIRFFSPTYADLGVEVPSLPAEIYSVFSNDSNLVVFDVGGDATGAIALGQYRRFFKEVESVETLYVINARRPFSCELGLNLDMIGKVTEAGRIRIDALVNNTNLSQETSVKDLVDGYRMVRDVSLDTGIPVKYTTGCEPVISEFAAYAKANGLEERFVGEVLPIERYMHRDWQRFTESGL